MSLLVSLGFLVFVLVVPSTRLRARNLRIKYCVASVTCLETMSGDIFSAISVNILPPVRNVSRPTALTPLQMNGLTIRNRPLRKLPIPCPCCKKGDCINGTNTVIKPRTCLEHIVLHEWMHNHNCMKMAAVTYFYYVGIRRKCRTTLSGFSLFSNCTRMPSNVNNSTLTSWDNSFSTGI
jgi:hypothetical protein